MNVLIALDLIDDHEMWVVQVRVLEEGRSSEERKITEPLPFKVPC